MTRKETINELIRLRQVQETDSDIHKALGVAIGILSANYSQDHPIDANKMMGLDEAARFGGMDYVDTIPDGGTPKHPWNDEDIERAYEEGMKAGAEWMKAKMKEWLDGKLTIEGATEGYVGGYDSALKDVIDKLNEK